MIHFDNIFVKWLVQPPTRKFKSPICNICSYLVTIKISISEPFNTPQPVEFRWDRELQVAEGDEVHCEFLGLYLGPLSSRQRCGSI